MTKIMCGQPYSKCSKIQRQFEANCDLECCLAATRPCFVISMEKNNTRKSRRLERGIISTDQLLEQLYARLPAGCRSGRSFDVYCDGWCGPVHDPRPVLDADDTTTTLYLMHHSVTSRETAQRVYVPHALICCSA